MSPPDGRPRGRLVAYLVMEAKGWLLLFAAATLWHFVCTPLIHESGHAAVRSRLLHWPTAIRCPIHAQKTIHLRVGAVDLHIGTIGEWRAWLRGGAITEPWPPPAVWYSSAPPFAIRWLLVSGALADLLHGALCFVVALTSKGPLGDFLVGAGFATLLSISRNLAPLGQGTRNSDGKDLLQTFSPRRAVHISLVLWVASSLWLVSAALLTYAAIFSTIFHAPLKTVMIIVLHTA